MTRQEKFGPFKDLGVQTIDGKQFYVSVLPSGRQSLVSVEDANDGRNAAVYRYIQDLMAMGKKEAEYFRRK